MSDFLAVLAIDPGATSGYAVLTIEPNPEILIKGTYRFGKTNDTPSWIVRDILRKMGSERDYFKIILAVIEDQYLDTTSKRNPDTLKKVARNSGRWEEACSDSSLSVEYVMASTWQARELGLSGVKREIVKRAAKGKAEGIWKQNFTADAADAALLGRYAAIQLHTGNPVRPVAKGKKCKTQRRSIRRN